MKGCYGFGKGIEVAGKLVDRKLQIIDDAQQKAADFLKKEVSKYDAGKEENKTVSWHSLLIILEESYRVNFESLQIGVHQLKIQSKKNTSI